MSRKEYNKQEYDKLLAEMVNNPSFFSDKDLAAQQITNELLKMMLPAELHKEAEATIQDAVVDIKADFKEALAKKKLEEESKARRVNSSGPKQSYLSANGEVIISLKEKQVEWKSEFGTRTESGYVFEIEGVSSKFLSSEEVRRFAQSILNITQQTTYRGV